MTKVFGTDGVRGKAGKFPVNTETVFHLTKLYCEITSYKNILIGWDTRESSKWIAEAVISAIKKVGGNSVTAGCIPTPVLSFTVKNGNYDGGIMITASHNPFTDNGLKFFNGKGEKIDDGVEAEIEKRLEKELKKPANCDFTLSDYLFVQNDLIKPYLAHLKNKIQIDYLKSLPPLDCANGAASLFIETVSKELRINIEALNNSPDGKNINLNCGAADEKNILKGSAALDGDGDRIMFKDKKGNVINGDTILMFLADSLKLKKLVGTVMTNQAVEMFCSKKNIEFFRTKVGDRHVKTKMNEEKALLGGETSGHIIFSELNSTGDGLAVFLKICELMGKQNLSLEKLFEKYHLFPQKIVNIRVKNKPSFDKIPGFENLINGFNQCLNNSGRVFPRYSGTENLLRILIECQSETALKEIEKEITEFFKKTEV